jgi:hypothetical protein
VLRIRRRAMVARNDSEHEDEHTDNCKRNGVPGHPALFARRILAIPVPVGNSHTPPIGRRGRALKLRPSGLLPSGWKPGDARTGAAKPTTTPNVDGRTPIGLRD